jgi:predicted acylesterase/phospholipase RssA
MAKVGIVLSGGGIRGIAHLGVLKALLPGLFLPQVLILKKD